MTFQSIVAIFFIVTVDGSICNCDKSKNVTVISNLYTWGTIDDNNFVVYKMGNLCQSNAIFHLKITFTKQRKCHLFSYRFRYIHPVYSRYILCIHIYTSIKQKWKYCNGFEKEIVAICFQNTLPLEKYFHAN